MKVKYRSRRAIIGTLSEATAVAGTALSIVVIPTRGRTYDIVRNISHSYFRASLNLWFYLPELSFFIILSPVLVSRVEIVEHEPFTRRPIIVYFGIRAHVFGA